MQSERKQSRPVTADVAQPRHTLRTDNTPPSGKQPLVESRALEAEIAAEVEHGQLSSDELNSSNDN